jgi:predicted Zn-dependent peptidase
VVATAVDTAVSGEAVADVLLELRRMQEAVVVDGELERARNYLSLGLPRRFETVDGVAEHIADLLLHDLPFDYYDHFMTRVRDVTAEEVRRVSEVHLDPGHIAVVVAGDHRLVEAPLSRLGIGPVETAGPEAFPDGGEGTRLA